MSATTSISRCCLISSTTSRSICMYSCAPRILVHHTHSKHLNPAAIAPGQHALIQHKHKHNLDLYP